MIIGIIWIKLPNKNNYANLGLIYYTMRQLGIMFWILIIKMIHKSAKKEEIKKLIYDYFIR